MAVAQEGETFNFQTLQHPLPTRSLTGDQRLPCIQMLGKKVPQVPSSPQLEPERAEVKSRAGYPGPRAQRDKPLATEVSQEKATTGLISLGPSSLCWFVVPWGSIPGRRTKILQAVQ